MATNTYVALDTRTISTAATSVEFTDIPQNYTDLVVVATLSSASDGEGISFQVGNGTIDTNTNYSRTVISGADDNGAASFRQATQTGISLQYAIGVGSNQPSMYQIHFMNYSNTSTIKTFLANCSTFRGTSTNKKEAMRLGGQWRSTSAINRIKFNCTVNINVGSTFTLYGIASSNIGAPKAFGGTVTQDSTYTYHTFGTTGTFIPQQSLSCDVLVIAGGGGGAANTSGGNSGGVGGGGAGGYRLLTSQSLTASNYTCTVGSGGAGATSSAASGANGIASSFSGTLTINTSGGGGGGGTASFNGSAGGSGGGGYGYPLNTYNGGAGNSGGYTPVEGYAGGRGYTDGSTYTTGGGGGGSSAAATQRTSSTGGDGGAGTQLNSWAIATGTGFNGYYAGGGGGGSSTNAISVGLGAAGGGNGSFVGANASNAIVNTGSGGGGAGGGSSTVYSGGNGGSGVIIIRYAN